MDLLAIKDENLVSKTTLSRKLTLGGVTKAYPVYRVRLDLLFYNDQNPCCNKHDMAEINDSLCPKWHSNHKYTP